jgi:hypothetical protein
VSGLVRYVWVGGKDPGVMIADAWKEITDVELTRLGARIVRDCDAVTHAKRA